MIPSLADCPVNICGAYFKLVFKIINVIYVHTNIFSNITSIGIEHNLYIPNHYHPNSIAHLIDFYTLLQKFHAHIYITMHLYLLL